MVSPNDDPEQNKIINEIKYDLPCNEYSELKPGIKLPKTDTQWKEADIIFRSVLHTRDIKDYNLTEIVERMNNVIYNYFAETYGAVRNKNDNKGLHDKYKDFSKHQEQKELRNLKKDRNSDVYVINYVSKLLRPTPMSQIEKFTALYTLSLTKKEIKTQQLSQNKPVQTFSNVYLIPQLRYLDLIFHHGLQSLKHS